MARHKLIKLVEKLGETPSPINLSALTFLREITDYAREQHEEKTMSDSVAQRVYSVFTRGIPQQAYALAETGRKSFIETQYKQTV
ncbi:hypothetical protein H8D91_00535 [archaeon]|nr:hypothetical protein [archaeon]